MDQAPAPKLVEHDLRAAILGELHARPFHPLAAPRRLIHLGFMTDAAAAGADRARLAAFAARHALPGPVDGAKQHRLALPEANLRWEQHSEFTTMTWDFACALPSGDSAADFPPPLPTAILATIRALAAPGPLLVAADLLLLAEEGGPAMTRIFDPASLAAASADHGAAVIATDFRPRPSPLAEAGAVMLLVRDRGMGETRAGALVQRVLEIETYRTLALLALPETQRLMPVMARIEAGLARVTHAMTETAGGLETDHRLLDELTRLAAALEAEAAASQFRFTAARAYDEIVAQRLGAIGEAALDPWPSLSAFLARRLAPAMRTCQMLERRQDALATRLARGANLLRTRVDVAIEQQNRDLLRSMNARTALQLRLQHTVEGLSIAAISYYVLALIGHVLDGLAARGWLLGLSSVAVQAMAVPPVVLAVALLLRRVRRHASAEAGHTERP
ncbi:MAG: DUF3422 domain-containing protein [Rhodospirillales bacterium]|nr:DUF3422 domain-containing protein [Rhodospirillales bacterium]